MILGDNFEKLRAIDFVHCVCDYCGSEFSRQKHTIVRGHKVVKKDCCSNKNCVKLKREESNLKTYGIKNAGGTTESREKAKKTWKEKYGTENPNQLDVIKEKTKKTNLERHGKEYYTQTDEFSVKAKDSYATKSEEEKIEIEEKKKETNKALYGCEYVSSTNWWKEKVKATNQKNWGVDSVSKSPIIQEKITKTNLERYGKKSYLATEENKQKLKDYWMEKLGVAHPTHSQEWMGYLKSVFQEKLGCDHPLKNEEIKNKLFATNINKYGNKTYLATEECKNYTKEKCLKEHGVDNYAKTDLVKNKTKLTTLKKYNVTHYSKTPEFIEKYTNTCQVKYGVSTALLLFKDKAKYGKAEKGIKIWLQSLGFNFEKNYKITSPKEIDMFEPNVNLAIEYCGNYWHSDGCKSPKDKWYHYNKYIKCKNANIRLLTIFEDEWVLRQNQCKNFIKSILGINQFKVYGRNCVVKEIDKKAAIQFVNENHIQSSNFLGKFFAGIFSEGLLLGVMIFGRHHRKNVKNTIVLDRMCFRDNYQVIGGASKLFKFCVKWAKENGTEKVISFSDNRWTNGEIYETLGFTLEKELDPDYYYLEHKRPINRFNKQHLKKSSTKCPKDKTESEWAKENGFDRIWDCGKKRWSYKL